MMKFCGRNVLNLILLCFLSPKVKGIRHERWDPLPQGVRNVVPSNYLSKNPSHVFAEYHALLPNYRGDYGVKSEIVDGALEEPVYNGANTLLLPFYIPQGALPLTANHRRVRSGSASRIANMRIPRGPSPSVRDSSIASAVNRPIRRIIAAVRRVTTTARTFPTPPPSYLQTWVKRKVDGSPPSTTEDTIDREKTSKRIILRQLANFKRKMGDSLTSKESSTRDDSKIDVDILNSDIKTINRSKATKGSIRIKKITSRIEKRFGSKQPAVRIKIPSTTEVPKVTTSGYISENTKSINTMIPLNNQSFTNFSRINSSAPDSAESLNASTLPNLTTEKVSLIDDSKSPKALLLFGTKKNVRVLSTGENVSTPRSSKVSPLVRRRPSRPRISLEQTQKRMKPLVPSRNLAEADKEENLHLAHQSQLNSLKNRKPVVVTPDTILRGHTKSDNRENSQTKENEEIFKAPDWLQKRREAIIKHRLNMKVTFSPTTKDTSAKPKQVSQNKSIIDRVLSSTVNHHFNSNDSLENKPTSEEHTARNSTINLKTLPTRKLKLIEPNENYSNRTLTEIIRNKKPKTDTNNLLQQETDTNSSISNISIPLINNANFKYNRSKADGDVIFKSQHKEKSNSKNLQQSLRDNSTQEYFIKPYHNNSSLHRKKIPLKNRFQIVSNPVRATTPPLQVLKNSSPSPVRQLSHKFINGRINSSHFNTKGVFTLPFTNIRTSTLPTTEEKVIGKTTLKVLHPADSFGKNVGLNYSKSQLVSPFEHKMKSPQDIVLEKLSLLMKNATMGRENNLDMIVKEIEKLNEELASMGIHIIDAEFAGHKIKLKDQPILRHHGRNSSKASTIRYVIPNSNSQSNNPNLSRTKVNNNLYLVERPIQEDITETFSISSEITSHPTRFHTDFVTPNSVMPPFSTSAPLSSHNSNKTSGQLVESNREFSTVYKKIKASMDSQFKKFPSTNSGGSSIEQSHELIKSQTTLRPTSYTTDTNDELRVTSINSVNDDHNTIFSSYEEDVESYLNKQTSHSRPKTFQVYHKSTIDTSISKPTVTTSGEIINTILENDEGHSLESPFHLSNSNSDNVINEQQHNESSSGANPYLYFVGILALVPCIAVLAFLYRQKEKRKQKSLPEREERADGFVPPTKRDEIVDDITFPSGAKSISHNETLDAFPGYIFESSVKRDSPWELPRSKLRLTSIIGEGNFGIVWKAEARNLCDWEEDGGPTVLVAVKGVKEDAGKKEKSDLLRELAIMQHLGQHDNIVTLLGCCTTHEPYYLVMEYVMFGKLLTFLREQRSKNNYYTFSSDSEHLTSNDLIKFAFQIATGCEYLQSRGVIHRDLAARNILVDHNKICKIADFGLARSVKDLDSDIYEQKSRGPLPIRWMSPESLFMNIFTHKSDVWSFGILCWEILTLGSTPYPGISAREVMRRVREGYRLERPEHCRQEFYRVLTTCWHQDRAKRASFTSVKEDLRHLLDNQSEWIDLEKFQESSYYSMHQNKDEKL